MRSLILPLKPQIKTTVSIFTVMYQTDKYHYFSDVNNFAQSQIKMQIQLGSISGTNKARMDLQRNFFFLVDTLGYLTANSYCED